MPSIQPNPTEIKLLFQLLLNFLSKAQVNHISQLKAAQLWLMLLRMSRTPQCGDWSMSCALEAAAQWAAQLPWELGATGQGWKCPRPAWMGHGTTWSSRRFLNMAGHGMRWVLRSLPTQTILGLLPEKHKSAPWALLKTAHRTRSSFKSGRQRLELYKNELIISPQKE